MLGTKYPFIREYNPYLTIERQCQYKSRNGVYDKQLYSIGEFKFLIVKSNFGLNKEMFDEWFNSILNTTNNQPEKEDVKC